MVTESWVVFGFVLRLDIAAQAILECAIPGTVGIGEVDRGGLSCYQLLQTCFLSPYGADREFPIGLEVLRLWDLNRRSWLLTVPVASAAS